MSEGIPNDIARLANLFTSGGWQELRVEGPDVSVLLSGDRATPPLGFSQTVPPAVAAASAVALPTAAEPAAGVLPPPVCADPLWSEVFAPNLGTFYRSPKPGTAPFVEVGQRVDSNTEVCLLEVMKLFTSVKAGICGTIRKVCVEDGVLVEGGQLLFLVEAE